ncbi:innexin inx2-like [Argiope bruennichi]|uniref:innexin inx2-like n=1 Tax=Argiope bruennichi TaxID=94029 RepID=UPI0024942D28|nr:innexin inx2-like [Argiope bruennichi]
MRKSFHIPFIFSEKYGVQVNYGSEQYHSYYQWFCFVLLVQAIMFYLPGHFWQAKEKGRMKKLVLGLDSPIIPAEAKSMNTALIVRYLLASMRYNRRYFIHFVVAEVWNFINVVGQVYFIDYAFGKVFTTYGLKVIAFTEWEFYERHDPMANIFPKMIECTLYSIGPLTDVMKTKTRCALPINEVSEKIYILLWFWFCILAILSGLALSFRLVATTSPKVRFLVTRSRDTACDPDLLKTVIIKLGLGDWFVLDMLAKNVDPQHFKDIVHHLAKELDRG